MSTLEKKGKELERWMAQGPRIRSKEMSEQVETFMFLQRIMFSSEHPYGSSQTSAIPVPGDSMPSPGFLKHQACMPYSQAHVGKMLRNIK